MVSRITMTIPRGNVDPVSMAGILGTVLAQDDELRKVARVLLAKELRFMLYIMDYGSDSDKMALVRHSKPALMKALTVAEDARVDADKKEAWNKMRQAMASAQYNGETNGDTGGGPIGEIPGYDPTASDQ